MAYDNAVVHRLIGSQMFLNEFVFCRWVKKELKIQFSSFFMITFRITEMDISLVTGLLFHDNFGCELADFYDINAGNRR